MHAVVYWSVCYLGLKLHAFQERVNILVLLLRLATLINCKYSFNGRTIQHKVVKLLHIHHSNSERCLDGPENLSSLNQRSTFYQASEY